MARKIPVIACWTTATFFPTYLYRDLGVALEYINPDCRIFEDDPEGERRFFQQFDAFVCFAENGMAQEDVQQQAEKVVACGIPLVIVDEENRVSEIIIENQPMEKRLNFRSALKYLLRVFTRANSAAVPRMVHA